MMSFYLFITSSILFTISFLTQAVAKQANNIPLTAEYRKFLEEKGYLRKPQSGMNEESREDIRQSLMRFQWFAGIPVTGKVDEPTVEKFLEPRCGMKDLDGKPRRHRRYVLQGSKWNKKSLSFRILNYTSDLTVSQTRHAIKEALSKWQLATRIKVFEKKEGVADIMISFTREKHGDQYPFDGPGGVLGHAFYPEHYLLAGDTHFDDDETFTVKTNKGKMIPGKIKNFYWVALHEFGHALGLEHSNIKGAVMYPWYESFYNRKIDLSPDDKRGIQRLYGPPRWGVRSRTYASMREYMKAKLKYRKKRRSSCVNRVEKIVMQRNGDSYVINGKKVYIFDRNLRRSSGPIYLPRFYKGVNKVDAVYRTGKDITRIFNGKQFWEFQGLKYFRGPLNISSIGIPEKILPVDAAFRWSKTKKVYLIKGEDYWEYDEIYMHVSEKKSISNLWSGVHGRIATVFEWRNKLIHVFLGGKFFLLDSKGKKAEAGYPIPVQHNLLVCKKRHWFGALKDVKPGLSRVNEPLTEYSSSQRTSLDKSSIFLMFIIACKILLNLI